MGTRFVTTRECPAHPKLKEWLLQLTETDTMTIQSSTDSMRRAVRTDYTQRILEMEKGGASLEEILSMKSGEKVSNAYYTGDYGNAVITAGQTVGLIHDIPTVKELIEGIISEAKLIVNRLYNIGTDS